MIRSIAFHPKAMNDINNNGRNEMMGRFTRFIRLNAFSSKAVIKTVHGRSSDLFPL